MIYNKCFYFIFMINTEQEYFKTIYLFWNFKDLLNDLKELHSQNENFIKEKIDPVLSDSIDSQIKALESIVNYLKNEIKTYENDPIKNRDKTNRSGK